MSWRAARLHVYNPESCIAVTWYRYATRTHQCTKGSEFSRHANLKSMPRTEANCNVGEHDTPLETLRFVDMWEIRLDNNGCEVVRRYMKDMNSKEKPVGIALNAWVSIM